MILKKSMSISQSINRQFLQSNFKHVIFDIDNFELQKINNKMKNAVKGLLDAKT